MSTDGLSRPAVPLFDINLSHGLDRLQSRSSSSKDLSIEKRNEELKKATQEFEALFIGHLLKVMRSTVQSGDEESDTYGKETYLEMFDQEIGLHIARSQSLGIGEMLYRRLAERGENRSPNGQGNGPADLKRDPTPNIHAGPAPSSQEPSSSAPPPPQPTGEIEFNGSQLEPKSLSPPVNGTWSSSYGPRLDPISHQRQFHHGVDVAAPTGSPIHAVQAGTVTYSGFLRGYGNTVIIEHDHGIRTLYAHAAKNLVAAGDRVESQQVIGIVGSTGRSTGSHLHFELEKGGEKVDPLDYLASSAESGSATTL